MSWIKFFKHDNFKKLVDTSDLLNSWIDYLRVVLKTNLEYFDDILYSINTTNSNYYVNEEHWLTFTRLQLKTWACLMCHISFSWVPIPIIMYNVFTTDQQDLLKSYWRLDLYWSFYRLLEIGSFSPDLLKNLLWTDYSVLMKSSVTRIDYKYDLFYQNYQTFPTVDFLYKSRVNSQSFSIDTEFVKSQRFTSQQIKNYYRWWSVTSWSAWSKDSKRILLRCYDKLLDVATKGKYFLYSDYFKYDRVIRIEFQLMNHFCKWFQYQEVDDLLNKFFNCLDNDYQHSVFYSYDKKYSLDELSHDDRLRYFSDFWWRWFNLLKAWINPFIVLYESLIIKSWKDSNIWKNHIDDMLYQLYEKYETKNNKQTHAVLYDEIWICLQNQKNI